MNSKIYDKNKDYYSQRIEDEYVIVPISDNIVDMNKVYAINETGAAIWNKINGKNSIDDIAKLLTEEFEIDLEMAITQTEQFISSISKFVIEQ